MAVSDLRIARLTLDDRKAMQDVGRACESESMYALAGLLSRMDYWARRDGKGDVIAYGFWAHPLELGGFYVGSFFGQHFRLVAIAVRPEFRRQGHGSRLLDHLKLMARRNGAKAITFLAETPARDWWAARGARPVRGPEGEWRMML